MPREIHKHLHFKRIIPLAGDVKQSWGILLVEVILGDDVVGDGGFGLGLFHGTVDDYFLESALGLFALLALLRSAKDQYLEHD